MKKYLYIIIGLILGGLLILSGDKVLAQLRALQGESGGTGFSSTTASNVGNFLQVASTSPRLTYTFAAGGSGSFTTTSIVVGTSTLSATTYSFLAGNNISLTAGATNTITFTGTGSGNFTTTTLAAQGVTLSQTAYTFATSGVTGLQITANASTLTWSQATSSATQAGFLQPADWTTFNNKASTSSFSGTAPIFYNANTGVFSLGITAVSSTRAINTTAPLFGGGDLSADRTLSLGIDAVSSTRAINTGFALQGGGDLSADRTLWFTGVFTQTFGQVHIASSSGNWTFTLPQTIWTTSTVQFAGVTSTNALFTNATTTNLSVTSLASGQLILGGGSGNLTTISSSPGDLLYYNGTTWARIPPNESTSTIKFLSQFSSSTPGWETVPQAGTYTFYLQNVSSTVSAYKNLGSATSTLASSSVSSIAASTTVTQWLTTSTAPGLTNVPSGIWIVRFDATKNGGTKNIQFYADVFKYSGSETLLFSTPLSQNVTGVDILDPERIDLATFQNAITLNSSDRLGVRVYAVPNGLGTDPSGSVFYQGVADAFLELPANTIDATNFVPYSGATANVDLGSRNLTTSGITSSTNAFIANSLSIPNGTNPTVDATGEVAFDTTKNELIAASGSTAYTLARISGPIGGTVFSSSSNSGFTSGTSAFAPPFPFGFNIESILCGTDTGTSTLILQNGASNGNALTCGTQSASSSAAVAPNLTLAIGNQLKVLFSTLSGQPNKVFLTVTGTRTRE